MGKPAAPEPETVLGWMKAFKRGVNFNADALRAAPSWEEAQSAAEVFDLSKPIVLENAGLGGVAAAAAMRGGRVTAIESDPVLFEMLKKNLEGLNVRVHKERSSRSPTRSPKRSSPKRSSPKRSSPKRSSPKRSSPKRSSRRSPSPARSSKKSSPRKSSPRKSSPRKSSPKKDLRPKRTTRYMTKFEMARVIGERAEQISKGSPVMVDYGELTDPIAIAELELAEKRIPIIVRRYFPDESFEDVDANFLIRNEAPYAKTRFTN